MTRTHKCCKLCRCHPSCYKILVYLTHLKHYRTADENTILDSASISGEESDKEITYSDVDPTIGVSQISQSHSISDIESDKRGNDSDQSSIDYAASFPWEWLHIFSENNIPNLKRH